MRERDIERYLVKRVKELGGEVRKVKWVGRAHAPDRVVMLPGRRLETKQPSQELLDYFTAISKGPCEKSPAVWAELEGVKARVSTGSPPQTIWVELKAPGKKPRPGQLREHERMRRMGQHVVVIDSFEGVEELLK